MYNCLGIGMMMMIFLLQYQKHTVWWEKCIAPKMYLQYISEINNLTISFVSFSFRSPRATNHREGGGGGL